MSTKTFEVNPVVVGFDSTIEIEYTQEFIDAHDMQSGTLRADFRERKSVNSNLIARKTTGAGIEWVANVLTIELTQAETALITSQKVFFDFVHENGGSKRKIPGDWDWPVEKAVTSADV